MLAMGTSYYPELIDPGEWPRDLALMRDAGLSVVRMLDFAWSSIEPREGEYELDWLDRFLDLCGHHGLKVILCTPTATPPPWLARQYPQIMIELRRGERRPFGARRDVCVNSPIYRHYCVELARLLGRRYGRCETVIGWQIDNELMGPEGAPPECHCPECHWRFRDWLKHRYAGVDDVNRAWGLRFWSQAVGDWGEITTPRHRRAAQGQVLDYARFFSDSQVEFLRLQYDALRSTVAERQFVTHNSTGVFNRGINHVDFARNLDIGGWDAYYGAAGRPLPEAFTCLAHDLFRSAAGKGFLILETAGGQRLPSSAFLAEMRAHGAKMIVFWHWRRHRFNQESGPNAICDYDGQPCPGRLEAIRAFLERIGFDGDLPSTMPRSRAAILYSVDCMRAQIRYRPEPVPYLQSLVKLYHALWRGGVAMDVMQPGDDLSGYDLAVAPSLDLMSRPQAETIRTFVARGGVLLACAPTAHCDLTLAKHRVPGSLLADVLGARMTDESLDGAQRIDLAGRMLTVDASPEPLEPTSAETIARFVGGAAERMPAATRNSFGKGTAYYLACVSHELATALAGRAAQDAGIPFIEHPHELVSAFPHLSGRGTWFFNHSDEPVTIAGHDLPAGDFLFDPSDTALSAKAWQRS